MIFSKTDPIIFCEQKDLVLNARIIDLTAWRNPARLSDAFNEFSDAVRYKENIRAIVLSGFDMSKQDLKLKSPYFASFFIQKIKPFPIISGYIASLDIPVIAAVEGNAVGLALELILACDLRIAAENSLFGFPHIQCGLIPWDGGSQRLSRVVGRSKALEIILTGGEVDAQEALRIGLIHKSVPPSTVIDTCLALGKGISRKAPIALRFAKKAVYKGIEMTLEQGLHLEADLYFLLQTTKDRVEGIQAFQEKRRPKFEGK
jgi:enoyl-CoA hydratase/carnithine racemase